MACGFHKSEYFAAVHVLLAVEAPIVLLATFLIYTNSPPTIGRFKWLLFAQQILGLASQLFVGNLALPVFFAPSPGLVFYGPLGNFLPAVLVQIASFAFCGARLAMSVSLFAYRHDILLPVRPYNRLREFLWKTFFGVRLLLCLTLGVPFALGSVWSGNVEAIAEWAQTYSCIPLQIDNARSMFLKSDHFHVTLCITLLILAGGFSEMIYYISDSYNQLNNSSLCTNLSLNTKCVQRSFIQTLLIQEFAPMVICYIAPSLYLASSTFIGFMNIDFNNLSMLVIFLHGGVAPLTVILANRSYRKNIAFWRLLSTQAQPSKSVVSSSKNRLSTVSLPTPGRTANRNSIFVSRKESVKPRGIKSDIFELNLG